MCQESDGYRFVQGAIGEGIGGDGFLWLHSDPIDVRSLISSGTPLNPAEQLLLFKGAFTSKAVVDKSRPSYQAYRARQLRLSPTSGDGSGCSLETDDDGSFLWAQALRANNSLVCAGFDPSDENDFDAFSYDAIFSVAHALHDLIEVQYLTSITSDELLNTLLTRVSFEGVTGNVSFLDASADAELQNHGEPAPSSLPPCGTPFHAYAHAPRARITARR